MDNKSDKMDLNRVKEMGGFQTARGKAIAISESALKSARKTLDEAANNTSVISNTEINEATPPSNKKLKLSTPKPQEKEQNEDNGQATRIPKGFQTARGKTIPVSEAALKAARKTLDEAANSTSVISNTKINEATPPSNNKLKLSTPKHEEKDQDEDDGQTTRLPETKGFQTARGKAIAVSESALKSARKTLDEAANNTNAISNNTEINEATPPASKKLKLSTPEPEVEKEQDEDDGEVTRSLEQEVLESTFVLLADEEENEGSRNAIFGDSAPIPLQHITQAGGRIPLLNVHVLRVYPVIYMSKNGGGRNVCESEKSYKKHQKERENNFNRTTGQIYTDVKKEVEEDELREAKEILSKNKTLTVKTLNVLSADELVRLIKALGDECAVMSLLYAEKLNELEGAQLRMEESIRARIQLAFEQKLIELKDGVAKPFIKLRVMDANEGFTSPVPLTVPLAIWKPDTELQKQLIEGSFLQFKYLTPTKHSLELRLNTTLISSFDAFPRSPTTVSAFTKFKRRFTPFSEILEKDFSPLFMELDTVGIIVHIEDVGNNAGHNVYIADGEQNILSVRLWTPIDNQGLEDEIKVKNFVAFQNLQWRLGSAKCTIPCAFIQDTTVVSLDTKYQYLQEALDVLRRKVKDVIRFVDFCQKKILNILNRGKPGYVENIQIRRLIARSPSPSLSPP